MVYEFAKKYGKFIEITSQEAKRQMDMINMRLHGIYNIVVNNRVIKIKCLAVYGKTRRIKILEVMDKTDKWVEIE